MYFSKCVPDNSRLAAWLEDKEDEKEKNIDTNVVPAGNISNNIKLNVSL